jgi:hypothetical protein
MKVYIQLTDECNGLYVKIRYAGLDVYKLLGSTSNGMLRLPVVLLQIEKIRIT